jgi:hypothetical protein
VSFGRSGTRPRPRDGAATRTTGSTRSWPSSELAIGLPTSRRVLPWNKRDQAGWTPDAIASALLTSPAALLRLRLYFAFMRTMKLRNGIYIRSKVTSSTSACAKWA